MGSRGANSGRSGGKEVNKQDIKPQYRKKFEQFTKAEQNEIAEIDYDGTWNILLRYHDRNLSEDNWSEVKWELKQMVKRNDFTLQW